MQTVSTMQADNRADIDGFNTAIGFEVETRLQLFVRSMGAYPYKVLRTASTLGLRVYAKQGACSDLGVGMH